MVHKTNLNDSFTSWTDLVFMDSMIKGVVDYDFNFLTLVSV